MRSNSLKKVPSGLPRGQMRFDENGDTAFIEMNRTCTTANMQTNNAAFEAWALLLKSEGYRNVILTDNDAGKDSSNASLHYNRFLYRIMRFQEAFDWFTISPKLEKKVIAFRHEKIMRADLCVGTPTSSVKPDSEVLEPKVERILIRDNKRAFVNGLLKVNVDRYFNQLPTSLFIGNDATDKTKIFPSDGARIDLWGLEGSIINIIELKVSTNNDLGVISELFFYASFMQEMYCQRHLERKDPPNLRTYDTYKEERGYFKLRDANIESVKAHFLLEKKHRYFDVAFNELQKGDFDGVQFKYATYPFSKMPEVLQ